MNLTTTIVQMLAYVTTVGFTWLAWSAVRAWRRESSDGRAYLALALGCIALVAIFGRVQELLPSTTRPLAAASLVCFEVAGFSVVLFRGTLVPLSARARRLCAAALAASGLFAVLVTVITGNPARHAAGSTVQFVSVALLMLTWSVCTAEPIVRFWIVSRGRPAVQRARLRALSAGFAGLDVILLVAAGVGPPDRTRAGAAPLAFALAGLALVPLLSITLVPPSWLRRRWRSREESALRQAVQALIFQAPDQRTLAALAIDWAQRLVGAESGLVVDPAGAVLAQDGLGGAELAGLLAGWAPPERAGLVWPPGARSPAVTVPLRFESGTGALMVLAGPFTPFFGADEMDRLEEYAGPLSVALDRVRLHEALTVVAATDALTGLCNRGEFERILARHHLAPFAVLAIDVDRLKRVNDTYGHEAGDQALRAIATALRLGVRDGDIVARTGGDEFAAFLPDTDACDAVAVAERLRLSMYGVPLAHGQARVSAGCAAGEPTDSAAVVWGEADEALYRAKRAGRDRCEVAVMRPAAASAARQPRWEALLPSLLARDGMRAVYQPVVDLVTGETIGFEALGRPRGQRQDISVDGLFATAERLGRGRDLDWACRRSAVQGAADLPEGSTIFVNVGVSGLLDPLHDVDQMLLLLRWARRSPESVVLEITEREAVHDIDRLVEVLASYREQGFRFGLDDVGAGHSTFEVLAAAVPEYVKVSDRLTRRAGELGPQSTIRALVTFATTCGSEVIAEGLEDDTSVRLMRRLGVTLGQGFVLGRPAPGGYWDVPSPAPWRPKLISPLAGETVQQG